MGREVSNAIGESDLPLIQGIVLFAPFLPTTPNLIQPDAANAYLDPWVRYE